MVWVMNKADGEKRHSLKLDSAPVFDGMIAADIDASIFRHWTVASFVWEPTDRRQASVRGRKLERQRSLP